MFDIKFYQKASDIKERLAAGEKPGKEYLFEELERCRSKDPVVFNIETTNACNMKCVMCPRTTMMTRPIETMDMETFKKVAGQIKPFTEREWREWEDFCESYYGVPKDGMSENHYFLYVIPKVIVLHGYGDPLLDARMPERINILTGLGIPSYFSCNPANINIDKTAKMFEKGLCYVKFSLETIDDSVHKKIRGDASNFTESYNRILELIKIKKAKNYKTTIVVTMLDLGRQTQQGDFENLKERFKDLDVYVYLKSQDQKWYSSKEIQTKSIHWIEFCQFPWSSMTVKSNGKAAMCVEDFNNEIILGDAKKETLRDIWNGRKYADFRKAHFDMDRKMKCTQNCDMKLIGSMCSKGGL
jgi:radical SAM protein with 4Fe4S-binding SPASM domain